MNNTTIFFSLFFMLIQSLYASTQVALNNPNSPPPLFDPEGKKTSTLESVSPTFTPGGSNNKSQIRIPDSNYRFQRYQENSENETSHSSTVFSIGPELGIWLMQPPYPIYLNPFIPNIFGMVLFWGGRAVGTVNINDFLLKFSLGYFFQVVNNFASTYTQQDVEFGVGLDYVLGDTQGPHWALGFIQYFDMFFTTTSFFGYGYTSPSFFRPRGGPEVTFRLPVSDLMDLTFNVNLTLSYVYPYNVFNADTIGLMFKF